MSTYHSRMTPPLVRRQREALHLELDHRQMHGPIERPDDEQVVMKSYAPLRLWPGPQTSNQSGPDKMHPADPA
jgi:hypothetical protein